MLVADVVERVLSGIAAGPDEPVDAAARADALRLLLTRFSISPKHLGEPGPSDDELSVIALAALRGPDHNKLIPFRFVVARGEVPRSPKPPTRCGWAPAARSPCGWWCAGSKMPATPRRCFRCGVITRL